MKTKEEILASKNTYQYDWEDEQQFLSAMQEYAEEFWNAYFEWLKDQPPTMHNPKLDMEAFKKSIGLK
jgi:hypothetical protein